MPLVWRTETHPQPLSLVAKAECLFSTVPQPVVQQQEGNTIQLADVAEAPQFPEDYAEGSSQLLLSAAFLTAELALLQKSFDLNIQNRRVSCPVPCASPYASAPCNDVPCLVCSFLELS